MPVAEKLKSESDSHNNIDDAELVRRFKGGDESTFAALMNRYQPRLLKAATVILKNEQDAMDIVQDVFVKAYFKLRSFREDSSVYTWLYRIMYNKCISHLRRKRIVSFFSFSDDEKSYDFPSSFR